MACLARLCRMNAVTEVSSIVELDTHLDQIAAEAERRLVCQPDARPPMVVVERRNGDTLGVVFARNGSMLHFISASCDPPYFTSVGDPTAEGLFAFEYEGHYSEAPMRHLIDAAVARAVIHSFVVADEGLPAQLNWETD